MKSLENHVAIVNNGKLAKASKLGVSFNLSIDQTKSNYEAENVLALEDLIPN